MNKIYKKLIVALILCIAIICINIPVTYADSIANPNYTGMYYATSYSYINATSTNCYLHAFKFTDSGNWRFANASNPSSYYIGPYDTSSRGFNATYSGYDLCDSTGTYKGHSNDDFVIIADSVDTWFDYFGNVTHRLINYWNISYIKTY